MYQMLSRVVVRVGPAGYQDNRQVLRIGPGQSVEGRKPPDTEGDNGRRRSVCSRISLSAVTAI